MDGGEGVQTNPLNPIWICDCSVQLSIEMGNSPYVGLVTLCRPQTSKQVLKQTLNATFHQDMHCLLRQNRPSK